jgi:hypothetical protein
VVWRAVREELSRAAGSAQSLVPVSAARRVRRLELQLQLVLSPAPQSETLQPMRYARRMSLIARRLRHGN